jgi:hypothetical protein
MHRILEFEGASVANDEFEGVNKWQKLHLRLVLVTTPRCTSAAAVSAHFGASDRGMA